MSESHNILRIFVASPSGLDQERKSTREQVDEINRRNSTHWKLQFKAVGWEDTVGGNRRAQDIINRDLETCDYFFGIVADHWGSPPLTGRGVKSAYTSGFEEEYELAQKMYERGEMKDILLFFKRIPEERLRDVGPSLEKVLGFRQKVHDERKPLYTEFDTLEVFKSKIGDTLNKIGWETITPTQAPDISAPGEQSTDDDRSTTSAPMDTSGYFLSPQTRHFLATLNNKPAEYNAVNSADVARLRLISTGMYRAGNDTVHLGVHDANLLFRNRLELDLSTWENTSLLMAGLRYMEGGNVPFWYWTGGDIDKVERFIQLALVMLDDSITASALTIAEVFGYRPFDATKDPTNRSWVTKWFAENVAYGLHNKAAAYLYRWGEEEDVTILEQIRDNASGPIATNIDCLIVGIRFHLSQAIGLKELLSRNPEHLSPELYSLLQGVLQSLPSELLQRMAKCKADSLRLLSAKELSRRNALTQVLAEELSGDSFVDVRLEAIKALSRMGVVISESKAREALIVEKAKVGLAGLFAAGGQADDTSKFNDYQRDVLERKSLKELFELEDADNPVVSDALLTACRLYPKKTHTLLRELLDDGFAGRFDRRLQQIETQGSQRFKDLAKEVRDLKEDICLKQTQMALDVLTAQKEKRDLALVRKVIDGWKVKYSKEILAYLARFGDWEDVERILNLQTRSESGSTVLGSDYGKDNEWIGKALYEVGSTRIVDLLDATESRHVSCDIVRVSGKKVFASLNDHRLLALMNVENDKLRKVTAVKCLDTLPKARIERLFEKYIQEEKFRYYNVIHWLDLGVSMPLAYVRKLARRELQSM